MTFNNTAIQTENSIGKHVVNEYFKGFDLGRQHAFNFVLEYLAEVPSGLGLEDLIKKIQQRDKETA